MTFKDKDSENTYKVQPHLGSSRRSKTLQTPLTILIEFACIFILIGTYAGIEIFSQPSISYLTCDQTDIIQPYHPDTITTIQMIMFGFLIPTIAIILTEFINSKATNSCTIHKSSAVSFREYVLHATTLFFLGMFVTVVITEVVKRWIGRLRPHFLEVCKPDFETINCFNKTANGHISNAIYTGGQFCTGNAKKIKEARLSFPSGHASYSTYCMLFLIFFLEARLFVTRLHFGKRILQVLAFIAAMLISLSRISDNQHRPSDVLGGFALGVTVALIAGHIAQKVWSVNYSEKVPYFSLESIKSVSDESIKASSLEDAML